jgi:hypothetical protein
MDSRLAFLVVALTAGNASADAPTSNSPNPRVAIVPGIAVGIDAAKVDALSQDLADALATELEVDAIGGLEVRRKLPADGVPPDCVATPACTADVAKRLGVSQLLFVVMVDTGGTGAIQVDSTWVEPASGKSTSRPAVDVANVSDAKSRFASAAHQLLPDATMRPKPKQVSVVAPKMSDAVPKHLTTPAIVAGAAGVVGLGVGIGFGLHTRSKYNACDVPPGCTPDVRDGIRRSGLIADAGFLVAIAGAVTTGFLFATSGKEAQIMVSPGADGGVSLIAAGRF